MEWVAGVGVTNWSYPGGSELYVIPSWITVQWVFCLGFNATVYLGSTRALGSRVPASLQALTSLGSLLPDLLAG